MPDTTTLTLTSDECEIIVDALEADLEDYLEAAREAHEEGNREEATTFGEAAQRVRTLLDKVRPSED